MPVLLRAATFRSRGRPRRLKPAARLGCLTALAGFVAGCATPPGRLFEPTESAVVWPPPPEQARIRWVGELAGSEDLNAGRGGGEAFLAAMRGPRPPIKFSAPHAVARRGDNWLAMADPGVGGVAIIDLGARTHTLVSGGAGFAFESPIGVAWAGPRLFVTDAARHEVVELDETGTYRGRFGADELVRPVGIAYVGARRQLYVVDGGAHCVVAFDLGGNVVTRLGGHGLEPGQFNYPSHICWDGGERLLVADTANFRVQVLDLDGRCVRAFGQKGDGAGDFALPKGVGFDSDGHVYVVDAQFENVQVFDDQGLLLLAFGQEGSGAGGFSLPAGLTIDGDDRIWVADSANRRVQVFDYLKAG